MIVIIMFLIIASSILLFIESIYFLSHQRQLYPKWLEYFNAILFTLIMPLVFIVIENDTNLDCCDFLNCYFAPSHRLSLFIFILFCQISFCISRIKKKILSPIIEILIQCFLIIGIIINLTICLHLGWLSILANVQIIYLFSKQLYLNHSLLQIEYIENNNTHKNSIVQKAKSILLKTWFVRYPILFFLCLPIVFLATIVCLLFGQQPDSLIRSFTDTYYHGLSQLTSQCDNIQCGGHYLCSVAANGSKQIVKPKRLGKRNGSLIICNRQLLIANAFENILEEYLPKTHKLIRKQYDKVGNLIHKNYAVYSKKYVANIIYFSMKPLEYFFLIVLYTIDKNPENRIEKQYY